MRQVEISVPTHAPTVVPLHPYPINLLPERGNCLTNWTELSSMCNLRLPIGDLQFWPEALAQSGAWLHLAGDAFPASEMSSCRCYAAISAISDSRVMASDGTAETAVAQTNNQSGSASISRSPLPFFLSPPFGPTLHLSRAAHSHHHHHSHTHSHPFKNQPHFVLVNCQYYTSGKPSRTKVCSTLHCIALSCSLTHCLSSLLMLSHLHLHTQSPC